MIKQIIDQKAWSCILQNNLTIFLNLFENIKQDIFKECTIVIFYYYYYFETILKQKLDRLQSNLFIFPIFYCLFTVQELVMGI